jgi:anti-sigma factor RsiW
MDRVMTHAEIRELLGAYALDAVDRGEAEQIDHHLAGCPECQAEVASYREVAMLMSYSGAPAPPGLWDRIAAGLEEQPPPLRLDRLQTPRHQATSAPAPAFGSRSSGRQTVSARVFTAVVALAAVVVIGLGIEVVRLNTRTDHLPSTVASQVMIQTYQAASSEFDARHVSLQEANGAKAIPAVILPNGTAYVDARRLPRLAADRTYQLWGKSGGTAAPVSLAVMGADPVIQQLSVPSGVRALAVTQERAGGSPIPTTPALAQGSILS